MRAKNILKEILSQEKRKQRIFHDVDIYCACCKVNKLRIFDFLCKLFLFLFFPSNYKTNLSSTASVTGAKGVLTRGGSAGDDKTPTNWQSASRIVRSLLDPRNLDDNSKSLTLSFTRAPRTYAL